MQYEYWIDPPVGWRFGFPKVIPTSVVEESFHDDSIREWLAAVGYPTALMGKRFPYRIWKEEAKLNRMDKLIHKLEEWSKGEVE